MIIPMFVKHSELTAEQRSEADAYGFVTLAEGTYERWRMPRDGEQWYRFRKRGEPSVALEQSNAPDHSVAASMKDAGIYHFRTVLR